MTPNGESGNCGRLGSACTQPRSPLNRIKTQLESINNSSLKRTIQRGKTNEVAIEDAKLTGAQVSFTTHQAFYVNGVAQQSDQNLVTESKFQGTIGNNTIKGKVERHFIGNVRLLEWEAKRVKP